MSCRTCPNTAMLTRESCVLKCMCVCMCVCVCVCVSACTCHVCHPSAGLPFLTLVDSRKKKKKGSDYLPVPRRTVRTRLRPLHQLARGLPVIPRLDYNTLTWVTVNHTEGRKNSRDSSFKLREEGSKLEEGFWQCF